MKLKKNKIAGIGRIGKNQNNKKYREPCFFGKASLMALNLQEYFMRKRVVIFILAFALFCIGGRAFAGEYKGIIPGISRRGDVEEKFGKPVKKVIKNIRYIYDSGDEGIEILSISYEPADKPDKSIVDTIDIYPKTKYTKYDYKVWFDLNNPFDTYIDSGGNRVEIYLPHCVRLHYLGSDDDAKVDFVEHFRFTSLSDTSFLPEELPYLGISLAKVKDKAYLKVVSVEPGSPVDKAGIKKGDYIVSVDDINFNKVDIKPLALYELIASFDIGSKHKMKVLRNDKLKELSFVVGKVDENSFDKRSAEAQVLLKQGELFLNGGKNYGAVELAKRAKLLDPYNADAYLLLGEAYLNLQLYDLAIDELKKSVKIFPTEVGYMMLGISYAGINDFKSAVDSFKKSYSFDKASFSALSMLADSYCKMGEYGKASLCYDDIMAYGPSEPLVILNAAVTYGKLGFDDKETECYDKLRKMKNLPTSVREKVAEYFALKENQQTEKKNEE